MSLISINNAVLTSAFWLIVLACCFLGQTASPDNQHGLRTQQEAASLSTQEVAKLISQLDSPIASEREKATTQLIESGNEALPSVAILVQTGSIEQKIRSREILTQIGINGDNNTLVKVTRIMLLLRKNGHYGLFEPARVLSDRWILKQAQNHELRLFDLRARIVHETDPNEVTLNGRHVVPTNPLSNLRVDIAAPSSPANELQMSDDQLKNALTAINNASDKEGQAALSQQPSMRNHGNLRLSKTVSIELDDQWKGTPSDLKRLSDFYAISSVNFHRSKIEKEMFDTLGLLGAKSFQFYNCQLSAEDLKKFVRSHSHTSVEIRPNAVLGVRGKATNTSSSTGHSLDPCVVDELIDGCPSRDAGLRPEDLITKIGDNEIANFQDLVFDIAGRNAGEQITITLVRNGETLHIDVKLGDSTGIDL